METIKRVPDPGELELRTVVSCQVDVENCCPWRHLPQALSALKGLLLDLPLGKAAYTGHVIAVWKTLSSGWERYVCS